jgi:hypothetical protein
MSRKSVAWLTALFLIGSTAGCGGKPCHIHGEVTYDGQPVAEGFITFIPADGKGETAGGPISAGRYDVGITQPGPKIAFIAAPGKQEEPPRPTSRKTSPQPSGLIPPDAEGNQAKIDVQTGSNPHDFHLKPPAAKKR